MEERIAILETEMKQVKETSLVMNEKLDTLIENMNRTKGFWAGAVAAGTALGAALGFLVQYILNIRFP